MAQTLTAKFVETVSPEPAQKDYFDLDPKGFGLRVSPKGTKSWILFYKTEEGPRRRHTLGRYPDLSLKKARDKARKARNRIADGQDPALEKQQARMEEKKAKAAAKVGMLTETPITMADGIRRYINDHIKAGGAKPVIRGDGSEVWEVEGLVERNVIPRIGDIPILNFRRSDAKEMERAIKMSGRVRTAERSVEVTRTALIWLADEEIVEDAPVFRYKTKKRKRDRVLSDGEIRTVWQACEKTGWPYGPFLQLKLLTGQRLSEVATMRWSDINEDERTWTTEVKSRNDEPRKVIVPFSTLAWSILDAMPKKGEWVFFSQRDHSKPFYGYTTAKRKVCANMPDPIPHWTLHDLRRTCRTNLPRLKVSEDVAEAVIGHKKTGIVSVYNLYEYQEEKRDALQKWADLVADIIRPKSGDKNNVVKLRKA